MGNKQNKKASPDQDFWNQEAPKKQKRLEDDSVTDHGGSRPLTVVTARTGKRYSALEVGFGIFAIFVVFGGGGWLGIQYGRTKEIVHT